jgi:hypothetical protein
MMARTNQRIITWLHGEATEPTDEGGEGNDALCPTLGRREEEREKLLKKKLRV